MTITIINSHNYPLSTTHVLCYGASAPVAGNIGASVLAFGATAAFVVPTGWTGNVAINNGNQYALNGDVSLIEGSFVVPTTGGYTVAVMDIDVSYV
jgi:hypothetical protein